MWQLFNKISIFIFFLFTVTTSFSKIDTSSINPYFRDSILRTQLDTAKWNVLLQHTDIYKTGKNSLIQKQKEYGISNAFIFIALAVLLILLLLRLLFEDFFISLLEGLTSIKKFFIFYKSKKYDSLFAILSLFILKTTIMAFVIYTALQYLITHNFTHFKLSMFIRILIVLFLFFTVKNIIEYIFNWVIDTKEAYKAFFLQNLFAEFFISILLMLFLIVLVYNQAISLNFTALTLMLLFSAYVVFNIIRSYQLMGNIRIPYKLHFFLYICAFKILPLLILVKYIMNNVIA